MLEEKIKFEVTCGMNDMVTALRITQSYHDGTAFFRLRTSKPGRKLLISKDEITEIRLDLKLKHNLKNSRTDAFRTM